MENKLTMRLGFVLLKENRFDMKEYLERLKHWDIQLDDMDGDIDEGQFVATVNGLMVSVAYMPAAIPDGEAGNYAGNNFMWQGAKEEVDQHSAHVLITCQNMVDKIEESAIIYTALCAAVCEDPNTIGVYMENTVFKADVYLGMAKESKEQGILPLHDLIFIGLYTTDNGVCAYTSGLSGFNKVEVEVIDSKESPMDVFEFMAGIVGYIVDYDVVLNDGETIGFSEEQVLPITLSDSEVHKEKTLKIGF